MSKPVLQKIRDGWANLLTGLGTAQDRQQQTQFLNDRTRTESELSALYRHNWLARRYVEALPFRALARGVEENTPWPDSYSELNFASWDEGAFMRAASLGRLYGGALLYSANSDSDQAAPPSASAALFVEVFTKFELRVAQATREQKGLPAGVRERFPNEWREENAASPNFGRPVVWEVQQPHPRHGLRFHFGRTVKFGGASRPPETSSYHDSAKALNPLEVDWNDSVLLNVWGDVQRYGVLWQNIDQLVSRASVAWLKTQGLFNSLLGENQATIRARVDVLNQSLGAARLVMLDSDGNEEYGNTAVAFSGLPELLQELQLATAGAFKMPVTELFGRAPAGMNATGESDLTNWYATVTEYRERILQPAAERYAAALAGAPWELDFPPVHIPTEQEELQQRSLSIQGSHVLWQDQVISADEWRAALAAGRLPELGLKGPAPEEPAPAPQPEPGFGNPPAA